MPFKEMLKPSPISRHTVITNNFSHTLLWRLDTCIQTLWIRNFNLLVETLGCHARIVTYLFRFNVLLNAEYLNKFFSESEPVDQFLIRILLLHLYEYQHDFIGPANCFCCLWKGWKYLHILWERFFHTPELSLVGKISCSLAWELWGSKPTLAAWQFWAALAHHDIPCDTAIHRQCQRTWLLSEPCWMLGSGRKQAACFCQHRAPSAKGIFVMYPWPDCRPFTLSEQHMQGWNH